MPHYIALIEDAGQDRAVGVWFPDLPGCTSGGDDIDQALRNAPEALELLAESFEVDGKSFPRPRTLTELKSDLAIASDLKTYMVALIELPARAHAAEWALSRFGALRKALCAPISRSPSGRRDGRR